MFQEIMRESEIYQLIMEEGAEKEHQRRIQDQRDNILSFLKAKYPELVALAEQHVSEISDIETLQQLLLKVGLSKTSDEVQRYLIRKKQRH